MLGLFLRHCVLAFNLLSFEGTCKLLSDLDLYRKSMFNITGSDPVLECFAAKKIDEFEGHDGENSIDDDDDFYGYENVEVDSELRGPGKNADGQKAHDISRQFLVPMSATNEGLFLSQDVASHGRVQDGGFTFAFGDMKYKSGSLCERVFLCTNGQVEAYIRNHADLIERNVASFSLEEMGSKLCQLEKLAPDVFKIHYLRYLYCLSTGDYPAAMDSLQRYFDYSAGKGSVDFTNASLGATTGRFQAGLLALASMHSCFGHTSQSLQALNEAIVIAQQNNDNCCLAYALASLCHLVSEVGIPSASSLSRSALHGLDPGTGPAFGIEDQLSLLLKCCIHQAMELKSAYLMAFSRLMLAKFNIKFVRHPLPFSRLRGPGQLITSPLDVCKTLKLSPYLLNENIFSLGNIVLGASSSIEGNVASSFLQLVGSSHLLRAASWELYGSAAMVRASALIHLICYADVASADDLALACIKLAQHLATFKNYDDAFAALDVAARKFPLMTNLRVKIARLQLIHDQALHRGEIKVAQAACSLLGALASPVSGVDVELKIDATHRHARTLLAAGQYKEAALAAHSLFDMCQQASMQLESVMALLLIANIHKEAETIVSGLPYALASLTLSQSFNMDIHHATAMVTLAELWLGLGPTHADQALCLLQQSMTMVLGHGGLELRGRAFLAMARCQLCSTSYRVQDDPESVLEPLQAAATDFESLQDYNHARHAFHLQALVYNSLHRYEERDFAATMFQKHTLALNSAQAVNIVLLPV